MRENDIGSRDRQSCGSRSLKRGIFARNRQKLNLSLLFNLLIFSVLLTGPLSSAVIIVSLSAPVEAQQLSQDRDIEIPVSDVRVSEGEVFVDIAYEARIIEVVETLEKDLARLLKKAAERFPNSSRIRLLISNRGEKICELEIPTEAAAQGAANAIGDEAMLAQMKSRLFIDFKERIIAEQKPGEWPRFSKGTFEEELLASVTEDEWKKLDESPAEEGEEEAKSEMEPGEGEQRQDMEGAETEGGEVSAGSEGRSEARFTFPPPRTVVMVLGAIALIGVFIALLMIRRKRIK